MHGCDAVADIQQGRSGFGVAQNHSGEELFIVAAGEVPAGLALAGYTAVEIFGGSCEDALRMYFQFW